MSKTSHMLLSSSGAWGAQVTSCCVWVGPREWQRDAWAGTSVTTFPRLTSHSAFLTLYCVGSWTSVSSRSLLQLLEKDRLLLNYDGSTKKLLGCSLYLGRNLEWNWLDRDSHKMSSPRTTGQIAMLMNRPHAVEKALRRITCWVIMKEVKVVCEG